MSTTSCTAVGFFFLKRRENNSVIFLICFAISLFLFSLACDRYDDVSMRWRHVYLWPQRNLMKEQEIKQKERGMAALNFPKNGGNTNLFWVLNNPFQIINNKDLNNFLLQWNSTPVLSTILSSKIRGFHNSCWLIQPFCDKIVIVFLWYYESDWIKVKFRANIIQLNGGVILDGWIIPCQLKVNLNFKCMTRRERLRKKNK